MMEQLSKNNPGAIKLTEFKEMGFRLIKNKSGHFTPNKRRRNRCQGKGQLARNQSFHSLLLLLYFRNIMNAGRGTH